MSKETSNKFSPEVRSRAVCLLREHRGNYRSLWSAAALIASNIGYSTHTLLKWLQRHEINSGSCIGVNSEERERIKALERENKELRRANEILKSTSAFFAQAAQGGDLKR